MNQHLHSLSRNLPFFHALCTGKPLTKTLRPVIIDIAAKFHLYKEGGAEIWAEQKVSEIQTIMNHFRRIANHTRWLQATKLLTDDEQKELRGVLDALEQDEHSDGPTTEPSPSKSAATQNTELPAPMKAKKKEKAGEAIDPETDEEVDWIWGSTIPENEYKGLLAAATAETVLVPGGVRQLGNSMKRPAAAAPGGIMKRPAAALAGILKRPAAAFEDTARQLPAKNGGTLYLTTAAEKTYFCIKTEGGAEKTLVAVVSKGQSPNHRELGIQLFRFASTVDDDKDAVKAERGRLLAER
jgi:hypothetical protein